MQPGSQVIKDKDLWEKTGWFHPFRRMPGYVVDDQKAIWTSPAHTAKSDIKWWAIFGGTTAALIATDHWTRQATPQHQRAGFGIHLGIALRLGLLGDSDQRRLLFHRHGPA